jgi:N-acetyl-gamma-glutamyl-phosphate reductase
MISIGVLGASGYTGIELVRLLAGHERVRLVGLSADRHAGKELADLFPSVAGLKLPRMQKIDELDFNKFDAVFCCLPHAATQAVVKTMPADLIKIDLSADFRLRDIATYEQWYGTHQAPDLQPKAIYGLTEFARASLRAATLIANPGCYPTAAQLALRPLLEAGLIFPDGIIIDAKSGVSGAGRTLKENVLAAEVQEGFAAYGLGGHRHQPEIEQGLSDSAGGAVTVTFTPHLLPINRGILETIYISMPAGMTVTGLREALQRRYEREPFVQVLPEGVTASTRFVRGSNNCHLSVHPGRTPNTAIICSALDNLIKGASGQAVQNFNACFGILETTGLPRVAMFP